MNLLVTLFGAGQLGVVFNAWMVGLVCVQAYNYYLHFPRDAMALKILVAWVLVLQIFNLFIQTTTMYHYLIVSFGDYDRLFEVAWEWSIYLGLIALGACSVQLFYAYRIFRLSGRNYLILGIIVILALGALGMCSAVVILGLTADTNFAKLSSMSWLVQAWLCVDGACDILIAVFQVYYLYRNRCGVPSTTRFMNTLILYLISTGLLTSILVMFELISFAVLGFNFAHVFLSYQMGAIHAMSFLANLDARRNMRLGASEMIMVDSSGRSVTTAPHTGNTGSSGQLQFEVNDNDFSERTSSQFNTSIPSSESAVIGSVILPQPEDSSTRELDRETRDSSPRGNEDKIAGRWA
ncbi:hypothetical protein GALMADRAFT_141018 [Galerina marginata CBS 339.88]|uniref:DUF6534 domain-containing protein n=1 Tax=Galerina marginata (strain CBS 339.88) TaxID=685588 RepID=A0A067T6L8_GALM3|nr:hypothetical protein GALMADRAFT_141018 [Galerina marginata CBS 339.88]